MGRATRMRAVMDDAGLLLGEPGPADQRLPGGLRVAHDVTGLPKAAKDPARHRPKRRVSRVAFGFDHTSEGVDVVARHNRAVAGQLVHELSVAVIHDVEDVEAIRKRPGPPRVVPHATGHAIESDDAGIPRETRQPPRQRGPDERRVNFAGMLAVQPIQQHICHQVHARPSFLQEIREQRDAQPAHRAQSSSKKSRCARAFDAARG